MNESTSADIGELGRAFRGGALLDGGRAEELRELLGGDRRRVGVVLGVLLGVVHAAAVDHDRRHRRGRGVEFARAHARGGDGVGEDARVEVDRGRRGAAARFEDEFGEARARRVVGVVALAVDRQRRVASGDEHDAVLGRALDHRGRDAVFGAEVLERGHGSDHFHGGRGRERGRALLLEEDLPGQGVGEGRGEAPAQARVGEEARQDRGEVGDRRVGVRPGEDRRGIGRGIGLRRGQRPGPRAGDGRDLPHQAPCGGYGDHDGKGREDPGERPSAAHRALLRAGCGVWRTTRDLGVGVVAEGHAQRLGHQEHCI
jgi:hypothetical protein